MRHVVSWATGPASIIDGSLPCITCGGRSRVLMRRRSVRGVTNEISNGSDGSRSYSVPGNSVDVARLYWRSILLKLSDGEIAYRSHSSDPRPVVGSKAVS